MNTLETLELIDKLYQEETLNYEKYEIIGCLIMARGKKDKWIEYFAETGVGEDYPCGIKLTCNEYSGYYYMGIVMRTFPDGSFIFEFSTPTERKSIHIYVNGDVVDVADELQRQVNKN
jgi:hypothetical protein